MNLIEERLHQIHADARLRRGAGLSGEEGGSGSKRVLPATFARVSQVTEGSPSAIAVSRLAVALYTSVTHLPFCAGAESW